MSETNAPVLIVGGGVQCVSHVAVMPLCRRFFGGVWDSYGLWVYGKSHRVLLYPTLLLFSLSISGAVTHGNLGTAFRHRGQICFVLAVLAMAGVQAIVDGRKMKSREGSLGAVSDHEYVESDER